MTDDRDTAAPTHSYAGPPAPWRLHGAAYVSLWRVPVRALPLPAVPGARFLSFAGRALCVTAWAEYDPSGTLAYREMLFAVAVRTAGLIAPACTVGPIWVDDETAAAGGRELWRIPKRVAAFGKGPAQAVHGDPGALFQASLNEQGRFVAGLRFQDRQGLVMPIRVPLWTIQRGPEGPVRTRCLLQGRVRLGYARWRFEPEGPLAFLRERTPLLSVRVDSLSAQFGV